MEPNVTAISARRGTKTTKSISDSQGVTADQVIENLLGLFERVGISKEVSQNRGVSAHSYPCCLAIGELLTAWYQDPAYLDNVGNPVPIRFRGSRRSFFKLAQKAAPNLNASLLLSELQKLGAVSIDSSKMIRVHMRSLPAYEDKRLAIQHTLNSLDGFIKTLHHNLDSVPSNSDQLFHRIAWTEHFDTKELPALKVRMRRKGQNFLESFDNWLALKSVPKSGTRGITQRKTQVSVGLYLSVD
jgi:hypothetical protein